MTILKVPGGMLFRPSTDEDRTQANEIAPRGLFARKPPQNHVAETGRSLEQPPTRSRTGWHAGGPHQTGHRRDVYHSATTLPRQLRDVSFHVQSHARHDQRHGELVKCLPRHERMLPISL
jgi:hypothetical protein